MARFADVWTAADRDGAIAAAESRIRLLTVLAGGLAETGSHQKEVMQAREAIALLRREVNTMHAVRPVTTAAHLQTGGR